MRDENLDAEKNLLHLDTMLTSKALERFNDGEISSTELRRFYDTMSQWNQASIKVLDEANKLGVTI